MMVGSTWKAKMKPWGDSFLPRSPKMNCDPAKEKSSKRVTPAPALASASASEVEAQHQESEGELQPDAPGQGLETDGAARRGEREGEAEHGGEAENADESYIVSSFEFQFRSVKARFLAGSSPLG